MGFITNVTWDLSQAQLGIRHERNLGLVAIATWDSSQSQLGIHHEPDPLACLGFRRNRLTPGHRLSPPSRCCGASRKAPDQDMQTRVWNSGLHVLVPIGTRTCRVAQTPELAENQACARAREESWADLGVWLTLHVLVPIGTRTCRPEFQTRVCMS